MTAGELIESVLAVGGTLKLNGDRVSYWLPEEAAHLVGHLRQLKQQVIPLLTARGGRIATFPHCPVCCSHYLYRDNNVGDYECVTCGRTGIEEHIARRVQ